ncbi:MAG: hypothetical protein A2Z72_01885 [Omnitrophica bacterium RBG_13_46_9]|nr:MAG: hypothetical protein A2Z72_01885 [Omnitrophica bacterium RBG_13_46_9]
MERHSSGIKIFAIALVIYGVITLLGLGSYSDFKLLCKGFPQAVIFIIYIFAVGYGILGILCGSRILRMEEWARKTAVMLVLMSLLLGLLMNPVMFRNLEGFYAEKGQAAAGLDLIIKSYILSTIIFTLFELSFVYYFTRTRIKELFRID